MSFEIICKRDIYRMILNWQNYKVGLILKVSND